MAGRADPAATAGVLSTAAADTRTHGGTSSVHNHRTRLVDTHNTHVLSIHTEELAVSITTEQGQTGYCVLQHALLM